MAQNEIEKLSEANYPEIRIRNVKPNLKKDLKIISVKEGHECFNDFMRAELVHIRDKYFKKYPELKTA